MTETPALRAATRSLLVYNLFFPLVFAALLPGYLLRMMRRGNFREHFGQRLGRYSAQDRARFAGGRWIWIHSISVGETLVALKLARELHLQDPGLQIALSVTTSTGFALASEAAAPWLAVLYNPIDAPAYCRAALDLIRPGQLVLIEGEVWPNLLAECQLRGIPVSLVNARLSTRSERRLCIARFWVGPVFGMLERVCVTEAADIARWRRLGVDAGRIQLTGSIKFDSPGGTESGRRAEFEALLAGLGVAPGAPILLAGSTWDPEERILAETFQTLRAEFPGLFLILVPRHVERVPEILRTLAPTGLSLARRSLLSPAVQPSGSPRQCDALIVDTTGELRDWYALAALVFIGKSLPGISQTGGQNPAEAAALGKPVLVGPHMENFAGVTAHLKAQGGLCVVNGPEALLEKARALLGDPVRLGRMGERARAAMAVHAGATVASARCLLAGTAAAGGAGEAALAPAKPGALAS